MDREGLRRHLDRLHRVRRERDNRAVALRLQDLASAARGNKNVMVPLLDAVNEYATLGEVSGVFRDVFGAFVLEQRL